MKLRTFKICGQILWGTHLATLVMAIFATVAIVVSLRDFHTAHGLKVLLLAVAIGFDFYLVLATGVACLAYRRSHRILSVQFACLVGVALLCACSGVVAYAMLKEEF